MVRVKIDRVVCVNCNWFQHIPYGSETCLYCDETGTLQWALPDGTVVPEWEPDCSGYDYPELIR